MESGERRGSGMNDFIKGIVDVSLSTIEIALEEKTARVVTAANFDANGKKLFMTIIVEPAITDRVLIPDTYEKDMIKVPAVEFLKSVIDDKGYYINATNQLQ